MAKATDRRPALAGARRQFLWNHPPLAFQSRVRYPHQWGYPPLLWCAGVSAVTPDLQIQQRSRTFRSILAMLKQVTGPATLRFERRVRRVKRATSGKHWNSVTARGTKGRRLSSVSLTTKQRAPCTRSPGSVSRGALSPSLRKHSRVAAYDPEFPPRRVLRWGSLKLRNLCHRSHERQHRIRRRVSPIEKAPAQRGYLLPSSRHGRDAAAG